MTEFRAVEGFEEVWRAPAATRRRPESVLGAGVRARAVRARLARIVARTPEVMVKVTGRTRDPRHLAAHLSYITRHGSLPAEDRDGLTIEGRDEVLELAGDWAAAAAIDTRRRANAPLSLSVVLSMPAGTDALRLRDAARAFAQAAFAGTFDYALVLHTDAGHPHVHLAVRAQGAGGRRLNPKKADLEAWRQAFALALRDRGVAAEATPRRARGVTRKAERTPLRKLRERHERGSAAMARVRREAYAEAGGAAFGTDARPRLWEARTAERQRRVRRLYLAQAELLSRSADPEDRALGAAVAAFVRGMPAPDTQRLALARELRAANALLEREADIDRKDRGR